MAKKKHTRKITPKQEKFCQLYIQTSNATEAYRESYSCGNMKDLTINREAKRLIDNNNIATRIKELQVKYIKDNNLSPEKVLKEWAKIGFSDLRTVIDKNGRLLPVDQWPDSIAPAISSIKIRQESAIKFKDGEVESNPVDIIEIKLWPKTNALEALSKNLGLFEADNKQRGLSEVMSREEILIVVAKLKEG